jgi:hypothetical protein
VKARHALVVLFSRIHRNAWGLAGAFSDRSSTGRAGTRAPSPRRPRLLFALAALVAAVLVLGVTLASAAAPTVTVQPASAVEYTVATVSGEVDPGGESTTYRFQYATQAQFEASEWTEAATGPEGTLEGSGPQPVGGELTGLQPGTVYHLRLLAENGSGPAEAIAPTFETKAVPKPTATIEAPVSLSATTARFAGHINPGAPVGPLTPNREAAFAVSWHFECTPACPGLEGTLPAGSASEEVSAEATGLTPGASYEVSLVATDAGGTETAGPASGASPAAEPRVGATFPSAISTGSATLNAQVDPEGATTTVAFQYLTLAGYEADGGTFGPGTQEVAGPSFATELNSSHEATATITGLAPATAYRFRAVATNERSPAGGTPGPTTALATETQTVPGSEPCPNQALQAEDGYSLALPDCRAYEQVTPVQKNGGEPTGSREAVQASPSGDRLLFPSTALFPGDPGGADYPPHFLSSREDGNWSTRGLSLPTGPLGHVTVEGWSPDLSEFLIGAREVAGPSAGPSGAGLYLKDASDGSVSILASRPERAAASFLGASSDGLPLFFGSGEPLLPGAAPGVGNIYEWDGSHLSLAGLLPDGSAPTEGEFAGPYQSDDLQDVHTERPPAHLTQSPVSDDGDRLFFTTTGNEHIYVRADGSNTVSVGTGLFMTATPDGSKAFYLAGGLGGDLTEFEVESRRSVDLTPGGQVQGVLGAADGAAGTYVYFVANRVLAPGASPGDCNGTSGPTASSGSGKAACSLYLWHDGTITFITTLHTDNTWVSGGEEDSDAGDWTLTQAESSGNVEGGVKTSRLSADGTVLSFLSWSRLTAYENAGQPEFYRYDAAGGTLACMSCNPTGAPATSAATMQSIHPFFLDPAGTPVLTRNLSADGDRFFFESQEALLPQDTNGVRDVYEWERGGAGNCRTAGAGFSATSGGCLYLISSGSDPGPSYFADASVTGDDAFFYTAQSLVGQDQDGAVDIYDARVGGGIAAQSPPSPSSCEGEVCLGAAGAPPPSAAPTSANFSGAGNPVPRKHKTKARRKKRHKPLRRHHPHPGSKGAGHADNRRGK